MKALVGPFMGLRNIGPLRVVLNRSIMKFIFVALLIVFVLSFLVPLLGASFIFAPVGAAFLTVVGGLESVQSTLNSFFFGEPSENEGPWMLIRYITATIGALLGLVWYICKLIYFVLVVLPSTIGSVLHDHAKDGFARYKLLKRFRRRAPIVPDKEPEEPQPLPGDIDT